jgi:hypothetical protein
MRCPAETTTQLARALRRQTKTQLEGPISRVAHAPLAAACHFTRGRPTCQSGAQRKAAQLAMTSCDVILPSSPNRSSISASARTGRHLCRAPNIDLATITNAQAAWSRRGTSNPGDCFVGSCMRACL